MKEERTERKMGGKDTKKAEDSIKNNKAEIRKWVCKWQDFVYRKSYYLLS